jgi:hypothetical protein
MRGEPEVHAGTAVLKLGRNRGSLRGTDLDRYVVEPGLPGGHRPNDAGARSVLVLDRLDVRLRSVLQEHRVLASSRSFASREPEVNATVFVNFEFGTEDLAFIGTDVGRSIAVELDALAKVYELELVKPASMNLDVQA